MIGVEQCRVGLIDSRDVESLGVSRIGVFELICRVDIFPVQQVISMCDICVKVLYLCDERLCDGSGTKIPNTPMCCSV